jgi:hypothetical protein
MIHWVQPPETLIPKISEYGKKVLAAIHAIACYWGQMVQDSARQNAPWQDRTGNARTGLFYAVDGFGQAPVVGQVSAGAASKKTDSVTISGDENTLIICLSGTVYYSRFLELSNGGKYAIIMSTIEANLPMLEKMLRDTLK